jgi:hypothetical protein
MEGVAQWALTPLPPSPTAMGEGEVDVETRGSRRRPCPVIQLDEKGGSGM